MAVNMYKHMIWVKSWSKLQISCSVYMPIIMKTGWQ